MGGGLFSNCNCSRGSRKDDFYMPIRGFCISSHATFQRCMVSIFLDYIEHIIEVFMDDFTVSGDSFDNCLHNLTLVLQRCIETNLVLNSENDILWLNKV